MLQVFVWFSFWLSLSESFRRKPGWRFISGATSTVPPRSNKCMQRTNRTRNGAKHSPLASHLLKIYRWFEFMKLSRDVWCQVSLWPSFALRFRVFLDIILAQILVLVLFFERSFDYSPIPIFETKSLWKSQKTIIFVTYFQKCQINFKYVQEVCIRF